MNTSIPVSVIALLSLVASGLPAQEINNSKARSTGAADSLGGQDGNRSSQRPPQPKAIRQLRTGTPNRWFDRTKLFMGEFLDKERVTGKFAFKHPGGGPVSFKNLAGSCQCAQAVITVGDRVYELTKKPVSNSLHRIDKGDDGKLVRKRITHLNVEPGEEGTIEVQMEMGGMQGYKDATLSITTTDPAMKQVTLAWQAKGVKLFNITPNDVFLNNMKWGDTRKFAFIVESEVKPDFKLLDAEDLPPYVKISKKLIDRPNGKKAWKVDGTFGPNADPKSGGAALKFKTDWKGREVQLNIIATITGPVSIEPGTFISFGKIRKGEGAERKVTITPNGDFKIEATKIEFQDVTLDGKYISASAVQEDGKLVVTVKIAKEAEGAFLVRGKMILHLNHPAIGTKKFNFNGILR
jgi:hypothetical protein